MRLPDINLYRKFYKKESDIISLTPYAFRNSINSKENLQYTDIKIRFLILEILFSLRIKEVDEIKIDNLFKDHKYNMKSSDIIECLNTIRNEKFPLDKNYIPIVQLYCMICSELNKIEIDEKTECKFLEGFKSNVKRINGELSLNSHLIQFNLLKDKYIKSQLLKEVIKIVNNLENNLDINKEMKCHLLSILKGTLSNFTTWTLEFLILQSGDSSYEETLIETEINNMSDKEVKIEIEKSYTPYTVKDFLGSEIIDNLVEEFLSNKTGDIDKYILSRSLTGCIGTIKYLPKTIDSSFIECVDLVYNKMLCFSSYGQTIESIMSDLSEEEKRRILLKSTLMAKKSYKDKGNTVLVSTYNLYLNFCELERQSKKFRKDLSNYINSLEESIIKSIDKENSFKEEISRLNKIIKELAELNSKRLEKEKTNSYNKGVQESREELKIANRRIEELNRRIDLLERENEVSIDLNNTVDETTLVNLKDKRALLVCSENTSSKIEELEIYFKSVEWFDGINDKVSELSLDNVDMVLYLYDNISHTSQPIVRICKDSKKDLIYINGTNSGIWISMIYKYMYRK
jgi:hypothetical protein